MNKFFETAPALNSLSSPNGQSLEKSGEMGGRGVGGRLQVRKVGSGENHLEPRPEQFEPSVVYRVHSVYVPRRR